MVNNKHEIMKKENRLTSCRTRFNLWQGQKREVDEMWNGTPISGEQRIMKKVIFVLTEWGQKAEKIKKKF